jgi:hypothetical protein
MKLICDRLSLSDALTMASGVVASRTPSPILLCLKLVARMGPTGGSLEISATDSEIGLVLSVPNVDIKQEGEALIPADKLNQIIRACDDSTVTISVDRTLATISTESSTFKVFGYEPREFPGVRKPGDRVDCEVGAGARAWGWPLPGRRAASFHVVFTWGAAAAGISPRRRRSQARGRSSRRPRARGPARAGRRSSA